MTENERGSITAIVLTCVNYTSKEIRASVNKTATLLDDKLLPNCLIELSYLDRLHRLTPIRLISGFHRALLQSLLLAD